MPFCFIYNTFVFPLCVGYAMSERMTRGLVDKALSNAVKSKTAVRGTDPSFGSWQSLLLPRLPKVAWNLPMFGV